MGRRGGATGGLVHRAQLRPAPRTEAQKLVLRALRGVGNIDPELVVAETGLPSKRAWIALAQLVDDGTVIRSKTTGTVRLDDRRR